jgi:hypothetical protein
VLENQTSTCVDCLGVHQEDARIGIAAQGGVKRTENRGQLSLTGALVGLYPQGWVVEGGTGEMTAYFLDRKVPLYGNAKQISGRKA